MCNCAKIIEENTDMSVEEMIEKGMLCEKCKKDFPKWLKMAEE